MCRQLGAAEMNCTTCCNPTCIAIHVFCSYAKYKFRTLRNKSSIRSWIRITAVAGAGAALYDCGRYLKKTTALTAYKIHIQYRVGLMLPVQLSTDMIY
jgi:hypothetical protein